MVIGTLPRYIYHFHKDAFGVKTTATARVAADHQWKRYVVTVEHQDTKVKSEIIIISLHGNVENQQNAAIAREITHQDIKNVQDI